MSKRRGGRLTDRKFQELAAQINSALIKNDGLIGDQRDQVELLFSLERKFKYYIQKYQQSVEIYEQFIKHILSDDVNMLAAKSFFRERAPVFGSEIFPAIRSSDPQRLMEFSVNHKMIKFIVDNWKGDLPKMPKRYYDDFLEARRILIENNLPLAVNRAKLFYRKTPRSHLTLLDLIDICTYGLISGIDKYVGEYSKVWRSVCIGRMVGYMIEEYSKTFLRMYPSDRKILYRANALKYRLKIPDVAELTKAVNESFEKDKVEGKKVPKLPITEVHIRTLLNGSSYISADSKQDTDDGEGLSIYDCAPSQEENIEDRLIKKDMMMRVVGASQNLTIIERKILKLKGVDL